MLGAHPSEDTTGLGRIERVYGESVSGRVEKAQIQGVADAGAGLVQVSLRVSPDFVASYVDVGQYVQVSTDDSQSYFALSCSPGDATWTLLVRPRGAVAEALSQAQVGTEFSISEPLGSGFDWDRTLGADVFVVVAGTGFAIAPPILSARIEEGAGHRTALLLGTDGHVPLASALAEMEGKGISITLCVPAVTPENVPSTASFMRANADLETALATRLETLRWGEPAEQRRRVCVFAAGPEALLASLQQLVRAENERAGMAWCELLLNA